MRLSTGQYRDLLATYLAPQRDRAGTLALLLAVSIALQLVAPQILQRFIDDALDGKAMEHLIRLALLFLAFAILTQIVNLGEVWVAENVGWLATNALRNDLALHTLHLDDAFHHAQTPGAMIERVDGDVARLGNFFARFVVQVIGNMLLGVGVLVMLARVDWRAAAIIGLFAVGAIVIINAMSDIAMPHWRAEREASARLFGFIEERLSGTEDIRATGATEYVMRRNHERAREHRSARIRAATLSSISFSISTLIFAIGTAAALGIGGWLYSRGEVTIGTVFLIYQYTNLLTQPIEQISRQMQDLQQAGASVGRVQELRAIQPTITDGPGVTPAPGAPTIDFDHVTFGYESDEPVIEEVDFHLAPGQVLGLIGRTGSGKTTITRLLARLHDPTSGTVRLGGHDVRQYRLPELRRHIGLVTQEIQLFRATVRDNLTMFDSNVPDDRIVAVLNDLGLTGWLELLPDGLDSVIAAGDTGLSAGEAQLLAFARVFLTDPDVVVLDEASSRLDPVTEQRLEHAIDRLLTGRTAIVIAHRLATVNRADVIMVLADGRIIEYGDRATLVNDPTTHFSRMLAAGEDLFGNGSASKLDADATATAGEAR